MECEHERVARSEEKGNPNVCCLLCGATAYPICRPVSFTYYVWSTGELWQLKSDDPRPYYQHEEHDPLVGTKTHQPLVVTGPR